MGTKVAKIVAKKVKDSIIITIGGKRFTKKVDAKQESSIKRKLDLYSKKPTKENLENITNIFQVESKKEVTKKGLKTAIKKETKSLTAKKKLGEVVNSVLNYKEKDELIAKNLELSNKLEQMQAEIDKLKKNEEKPTQTHRSREGEY